MDEDAGSSAVQFEKWWGEQTRKGDPAHRPNLVRDAFQAGFSKGMEWQEQLDTNPIFK